MAKNVQETASSIRSKVDIILGRQNMLAQQLTAEREKVDALSAKVGELSAEVRKLKADNEYLTVMRAVALTPQQAEQSRALLAGLVREIDLCIAELKAC